MNKKWFVVIFIILALDIVIGFLVKKSFINTEIQSVSENIVDQCIFLNGGSFKGCNNENFSLEKIIRDSEVIVKGTALSDRIYLKGSVLTAFNVIKAYKGDTKNLKIYIFEPSYLNLGKYNNYFAYCGYNLMKPGHNYILFLKKWKYTNFVRYNPYYRGKEIYVFAHNSAVDKFEINKSNTTKVINLEGDKLIKYGQVKDYEVFVYNKNELTEYYLLKDKILNWISQN
ncbi:hypothetical protein Calkro_1951 [Caldicellulosiruptor kronotskyensis 2002]|uniref:Uncharacterized protein n=1 Tax=Caldicellulosiruptor kronotskyensis (strain DSM 18902 / VKM B-2412 / 2002) TaxID=632348 RepID=E4SGC0_CALK2|nr:hypothetical protein [Caldicellulosiruptor kronotskyensis]ADQ46795.1 hypothetical protein Calkro_1951 [Caldicellulosiruptor kronotskyensis 2002]